MRWHLRVFLLFMMSGLAGCATETPPLSAVPPSLAPMTAPRPLGVQSCFMETGLASFYGTAHEGKITADGESFDQQALTATHRTLAFGTMVRVTNLANGRMVKVEINDRGAHIKGRIIALSSEVARALGMKNGGIARAKAEAFGAGQSGAG